MAIRRALELNHNSAEAHASAAFVAFWLEWDFAAAEQASRKAVSLNPNSPGARETFAALLANFGRREESIEHIRVALALDPLSPHTQLTAAWVFTAGALYREAVECGHAALKLAPDSQFGFIGLGWPLVELVRLDEATDMYHRVLRQAPNDPMASAAMTVVRVRAGDPVEAMQWLRKAEGANRPSFTFLTWAYAALGMFDEAFAALNKAIAAKEGSATCMPVFAWWDPLRADGRFLEALRHAGYPETALLRTLEFRSQAASSTNRALDAT